jgi:FkbM family methyltransferase
MSFKQLLSDSLFFLYNLVAPQSGGALSKREKRLVMLKLAEFRFRYMLKNRFKVSFDKLSVLEWKIRFLDLDFFHFNLNEVFLNEEYFFQSQNSNPVIVDCGSNIGLATLYFKKLYPGATIIAIEAHPKTFAVFEQNIKENNLSNVFPNNAALSAFDGETTEIFSIREGDLRTSRIKDLFGKESANLVKTSVRATKLSTLLPDKVDLLKMDVEGSEIEIFQEIENDLHKINQILLEFHYIPNQSTMTLGQFLQFLEKNDYQYRLNTSLPAPVFNSAEKIYTAMIHAYRRTGA